MARPNHRLSTLALACALVSGCTGALGDQAAGPRGSSTREPPGGGTIPPYTPPSTSLRRLTVVQYENSVRDLLGADLEVRDAISPDLEEDDGFELVEVVAAGARAVSELDIERYDIAARALTEVVFRDAARREALVGCAPSSDADPCIEAFVRGFLRRAWRRPAEEDEVARYVALVRTGATELGSVWLGLRYAVATVLESPFFIYRVELGHDGVFDDFELASRLSYLVWNTTPDDALLDAAERGELSTDEGLTREVDRLLASERARAPIQRFFADWLGLDGLDRLSKNDEVYPLYQDGMGRSMRRELELLIDSVLDDDTSVLSLFDLDHTFVNADLAAIYGLPPDVLEGTTTVVEHWEAEAASPSGCAVIPGYANICSEAELAREVTLPSAGRHRVSFRVYGAQAADEPVRIRVTIDGATIAERELRATESAPETLRFERELPAGRHRVAIAFLNDYYMLPDNRDLRVDWVRVEALGAAGSEFVEVTLPPERRGLLTLAGPLALYARPIDTSPTQRGLFIRERLLCEHVAPPPVDVDPSLPPPPPDRAITNRERVALHLTEPRCAGCHEQMDPLGLPLEHFDGLGVYRETDRGLPLDVSGHLDGVDFDGALELADLVAHDPRVADCVTKLVLRRASGRRETARQLAAVRSVSDAWSEQGHSLRALIRTLVLDESFRRAGEPQ